MRSTFLAGVSVISVMAAGALPAAAADLPARLPAPAAAPAGSWTGFYFGSHVGNAFGRSAWESGDGAFASPLPFYGSGTSDGLFGGVQAGFNQQLGRAVLGVEIEGSVADLSGDARCATAQVVCNTRIDAMGTLTGRLGWTFDSVLVYAKAGGAWAHSKHRVISYAEPGAFEGDADRFGVALGGGVEVALSPAWSARLEYDRLDFGSDTTALVEPAGERGAVAIDQQIHRVKLGLNRRLDWGLPGTAAAAGGWPAGGAGAPGVPVKAAAPAVPAWTIVVGSRIWYSTGHYQKDLFDPINPTRLNSRLVYQDMDGVAGETFGRLDHRSGLFLKGNLGAGVLTNGTLHDEDFPGEDFYSNTVSEMRQGRMRYGSADVGWNVIDNPSGRLGGYLGYRYFHERGNGFGCRQIAGDAVCDPAFPTTQLGLSETETWRGAALGLNGQLRLTDRLTLEVDGAVLPYVRRKGHDNHWFRADINPQIESGTGWGAQVEAILSYAVTSQWSVGVGGRYWYFTTTDARTQFPGVPSDSPMKFTAERYGAFLQAAYTIDGTGPAAAAAAAGGVFKAPRATTAPTYDWTGIYVGGHAGMGWGRTEWTTPSAGAWQTTWSDVDGMMAGAQVGANYQVGPWVIGVEGSYSFANLDGYAPCASTYTCHTRADGLGAVTARAGWAMDNVLLYGKAGIAWLREAHEASWYSVPGAPSAEATRTGWTVGSGIEYGIAPNWSARLEYNWSDFGAKSIGFTDQFGVVTPIEIAQTVQDVRLGLNYRFGPAGAVPQARPSAAVAGLFSAPSAPRVSWSGVYAGIHVGGGHAGEDWTNPFGPQIFGDTIGSGGWLAGGQLGYNHQIGSVVLGVEADASAANLDGTNTCLIGLEPTVGGVDCRSQVEMLATLTGRAGWAFDRSLVYVKGGAAFARDRRELNLVGVGDTIRESTTNRWGWTIGGGLEHAVLPNLSVKLEYDYVALGDDTVGFGLPPAFAVVDNRSVSQDVHVAKLGVNYLFNTPLPVQAKY